MKITVVRHGVRHVLDPREAAGFVLRENDDVNIDYLPAGATVRAVDGAVEVVEQIGGQRVAASLSGLVALLTGARASLTIAGLPMVYAETTELDFAMGAGEGPVRVRDFNVIGGGAPLLMKLDMQLPVEQLGGREIAIPAGHNVLGGTVAASLSASARSTGTVPASSQPLGRAGLGVRGLEGGVSAADGGGELGDFAPQVAPPPAPATVSSGIGGSAAATGAHAAALPSPVLDASAEGAVVGDRVTNSRTPAISGGGGTPGDTVTVTTPTGEVLKATVRPDGSWLVTPTVAIPVPADGHPVDFTVTNTDASGATSAAIVLPVTIDLAAPKIDIQSIGRLDAAGLPVAGSAQTPPGVDADNYAQLGRPDVAGGVHVRGQVDAARVMELIDPASGAKSYATASDVLGYLTQSGALVAGADGRPVVVKGSGQAVTVTLSDAAGHQVQASARVADDGKSFDVYFSKADLSNLGDGALTAVASVSDTAGNAARDTDVFANGLDTALPAIDIQSVAGDGQLPPDTDADGYAGISAAERAAGFTVGGATGRVPAGQSVTVTLADNAGHSLVVGAVVDAAGHFSAAVGPNALAGFVDGKFSVKAEVVDTFGQTASDTDRFGGADGGGLDTVALVAPASLTADGIVNASEKAAVPVTGSTTGVEAGQTVTVTIGDSAGHTVTVHPLVDARGNYAVTADLSGLVDGPLTVNTTVADQTGNSSSVATGGTLDSGATLDIVTVAGASQSPPGTDANGYAAVNAAAQAAGFGIAGATAGVEAGRTVTVTLGDGAGDSLVLTGVVDAAGKFTVAVGPNALANAGFIDGRFTVRAEVDDVAGNQAVDSDLFGGVHGGGLDTMAQLTPDAGLTPDNVVGAAEKAAVPIAGATRGVEAGQTVTVTITDSAGHTVTVRPVVDAAGNYAIPADLGSLADGPLTVATTVTDKAGNTASAVTHSALDTAAQLAVNPLTADNIVNGAEKAAVPISGSSTGVEAGQTVTVTITDSAGNVVTVYPVVGANGNYTIPANLSALMDGPLTVAATVTDKAGNSGTATSAATLDTAARVDIDTVAGAGQTPLALDGDGYATVGKAAQAIGFTVAGATTGVEAGRTVTVTLADGAGHSLAVTGVVDAAGRFSAAVAPNALAGAGFVDGKFSIKADVSDLAGNAATDTDHFGGVYGGGGLDTNALLSPAGLTADNIVGATEKAAVPITGSTSGVEPGQTVTVTLTDSAGNTVTLHPLVDANGNYAVTANLGGLVDGPLAVSTTVADRAGNSSTVGTTSLLDSGATIDIQTVAGGSQSPLGTDANGYMSVGGAAQAAGFTVDGMTTGVEAGRTVTVTLADGAGDSLVVTGVVDASGHFTAVVGPNALLNAGFTDGKFSVKAEVSDLAGNLAVDTDLFGGIYGGGGLDTSAQANPGNGLTADNVVGAGEKAAVPVTGSTTGVEAGQTVTVTITDSAGNTVTVHPVVDAAGKYAIPADLSGLVDGPLTIATTVTDQAGNTASATSNSALDTTARVAPAAGLTADNVVNGSEKTAVPVSGGTTGVEAGQTVTVTITDSAGNTVTVYPVVDATGNYSIPANLAGLVDGPLSIATRVTDKAGNTGTATTASLLDTGATVDIRTVAGVSQTPMAVDADGYATVGQAAQAVGFTVAGATTGVEAGRTVTVTLGDGAGHSLAVSGVVDAAGQFSAAVGPNALASAGFADGKFTVKADVSDLAGNAATDTDRFGGLYGGGGLDTSAQVHPAGLTGDNLVNGAEKSAVPVSGSTSGVEPGQTVTVTLTDSAGNSVAVHALVDALGNYAAPANLAGLVDGPLTIATSVADQSGNTSSATTASVLDSGATIDIQTVGGGSQSPLSTDANGYMSVSGAEQAGGFTVDGMTTGVEAGRTVTVTLADGAGDSLVLTGVVDAAGHFTAAVGPNALANAGFVDGKFTVKAEVSDLAGNLAVDTDLFGGIYGPGLDTTAQVSPAGGLTPDNIVSASEKTAVPIAGTTSGVEPGQTVTVTLTDSAGNTVTVHPVVDAAGKYTMPADLGGLVDGPLTVNTTVTDKAGNTSGASTTSALDTTAAVTIDPLTGDDSIGAGERTLVALTGHVTGVEAGQTVTLTVGDSAGVDVTVYTVVKLLPDGTLGYSANVNLSSLATGTLTTHASVADQAGNAATAVHTSSMGAVPLLDIETVAGGGQTPLTVDGNGYATVGRAEVAAGFSVAGVSGGVENGQTVTVTVRDAGGASVVVTAVVAGGAWSAAVAPNALAGFADGALVVSASVSNAAGNLAGDTDSFGASFGGGGLDSKAAIEIDTVAGDSQAPLAVDANGYAYLNKAEQLAGFNVGGKAAGVEVGQTVTVTLNDGAGHSLTVSSVVQPGGAFVAAVAANALAAAGFVDGKFTVRADVSDAAGNAASDTDQFGGADPVTGLPLAGGLDALTPATLDIRTVAGESQAPLAVDANGYAYVSGAEQSAGFVIAGVTGGVEAGRGVTVTLADGAGDSLVLTGVVDAAGNFAVSVGANALAGAGFVDGKFTVRADVSDAAGNAAADTDNFGGIYGAGLDTTAVVAPAAGLTPDNIVNAAEKTAVPISGTTVGVEAGQTVTVTISDSAGNTVTVHPVVDAAGKYTLPADLGGLVDGPLTIATTVTDKAGNTGSAVSTSVLDTTAAVTIDPLTGDDAITGAERAVVALSGHVTGVEAGQTVTLTVSDSAGVDVTVYTVVKLLADGTLGYSSNVNLSSLAAGPVTTRAGVGDVAGNAATAVHHSVIAAAASVDIEQVAGHTQSPLGVDANGYATVDKAAIAAGFAVQGVSGGVEDGRTVTVTLSDALGASVVVTAVVAGGAWSAAVAPNALAGFADGALTVKAAVSNAAGNSAGDTDSFGGAFGGGGIDTAASIDIDTVAGESQAPLATDANGYAYLNKADLVGGFVVGGRSGGVEAGQSVTVTIADGAGHSLVVAGVVQVGGAFSAAVAPNALAAAGFVDGKVTVRADVSDAAGNAASDTDQFGGTDPVTGLPVGGGLDALTAATIDIRTVAGESQAPLATDANGYASVSAAEQGAGFTVAGATTGVEAGQGVTVTLTDGAGDSLVVLAVVDAAGNFVAAVGPNALAGAGFVDGRFTVKASVGDLAGNAASDTDNFGGVYGGGGLDTSAQVSPGGALTPDNVVGAAEKTAVPVTGSTVGVEAGQTVTVTITDGAGHTVTVHPVVDAAGKYTIPADLGGLVDGPLTIATSVTDKAGNSSSATSSSTLDTTAQVAPAAGLTADNVVNASEKSAVPVSGGTSGVEAGQTVTVTITDSAGNTVTVYPVVGATGSYTIPANLGGLVDGPLTIATSVTDKAGNTGTATTTSVLDTAATVDIETVAGFGQAPLAVDADGYATLDKSAQAAGFTVAGATTGVEAGRSVTVTLADSAGHSLVATALVDAAGHFGAAVGPNALAGAGFADGRFSARANVSDAAGNAAADTDNFGGIYGGGGLDTTALVTPGAGLTADNIVNAAEKTAVPVAGTTSGVEAGQTVTVTITDSVGNTVTVHPVVDALGNYTAPANLNGLVDGPLTIATSVTDKAGNTSTSTGASTLDAGATVDIDTVAGASQAPLATDANGYSYVSAAEQAAGFSVGGASTGVEAGRTVTVTLGDGAGDSLVLSGTTDAAGRFTVAVGPNALAAAGFVDGKFTVKADVSDAAGNAASDTDQFGGVNGGGLDTTAALDIQSVAGESQSPLATDADGYAYVSAAEKLAGFAVAGKAGGVEAGQTVTVTLADGAGHTLNVTTTVQADGSFTANVAANALGAAGFVDGKLQVGASAVDKAGNTAADTDQFGGVNGSGNPVAGGLDTAATVDIRVIGAAAANTATAGDYNGYADISAKKVADGFVVSGVSTGVQAGQSVQVTLSDSAGTAHTLQGTALVGAGGAWTYNVGNNALLNSGFVDGLVTVGASVADLAGNVALDPSGGDSFVLDTAAPLVDVQSIGGWGQGGTFAAGTFAQTDDHNSYAYLNRQQLTNGFAIGGATDAAVGSVVTVTLTDSVGGSYSITATVVAGTAGVDQIRTAAGTVVDANKWVANVPANGVSNLLNLFTEGAFTVTAAVADAAGNVGVDVDGGQKAVTTLPSIDVQSIGRFAQAPLVADGGYANWALTGIALAGGQGTYAGNNQSQAYLGAADANTNGFGVAGVSAGIANGQTVTVVLTDAGGVRASVTTTVANGMWSALFAPNALAALADGAIKVVAQVADTAGNWATNLAGGTNDGTLGNAGVGNSGNGGDYDKAWLDRSAGATVKLDPAADTVGQGGTATDNLTTQALAKLTGTLSTEGLQSGVKTFVLADSYVDSAGITQNVSYDLVGLASQWAGGIRDIPQVNLGLLANSWDLTQYGNILTGLNAAGNALLHPGYWKEGQHTYTATLTDIAGNSASGTAIVNYDYRVQNSVSLDLDNATSDTADDGVAGGTDEGFGTGDNIIHDTLASYRFTGNRMNGDRVTLFRDVNANGIYDAGTDTLLGSDIGAGTSFQIDVVKANLGLLSNKVSVAVQDAAGNKFTQIDALEVINIAKGAAVTLAGSYVTGSAFGAGTGFADLDMDGDLDVYTASTSNANNQDIGRISVNAATGAIGVSAQADVPGLTSASTFEQKLGDFNNDGAIDLVIGAAVSAPDIRLAINAHSSYANTDNGQTASFIAAATLRASTGNAGGGPSLGDFNKDGNLDYFAVDNNNVASRVRLGDGDANHDGVVVFGAADPVVTNFTAAAVGGVAATGASGWSNQHTTNVVDFDLDGDLDIMVVDGATGGGTSQAISHLYRNNLVGSGGALSFTRDASVSATGTANSNFIGRGFGSFSDFDGDGDIDYIAADRIGTVHIFRNEAGVLVDRTSTLLPSLGAYGSGDLVSMIIVDINHDGKQDILLSNFNTGSGGNDGVFIFNAASGTFQNQTVGIFGANDVFYAHSGAADLNYDGALDIAGASVASAGLSTSIYQSTLPLPAGTSLNVKIVNKIGVADLNNTVVSLYEAGTNTCVGSQIIDNESGRDAGDGSSVVHFYGLDPSKKYDLIYHTADAAGNAMHIGPGGAAGGRNDSVFNAAYGGIAPGDGNGCVVLDADSGSYGNGSHVGDLGYVGTGYDDTFVALANNASDTYRGLDSLGLHKHGDVFDAHLATSGMVCDLSALVSSSGGVSGTAANNIYFSIAGGGLGADLLNSIENISATQYDDTLTGNSSTTTTDGTVTVFGSIDNTFYGMAGNDAINGKAGNDILWGNTGSDNLTGGAGRDFFKYKAETTTDATGGNGGNGIDTITDFKLCTANGGGNATEASLAVNGAGVLVAPGGGVATDANAADVIDLIQLLQTGGYRGNGSAASLTSSTDGQYISVDWVGADTLIKIDYNGSVGGANLENSVLLSGVHTTLEQLIANHQLLVQPGAAG